MFLANLSALIHIHSYLRWVSLILLVSLTMLCFSRWIYRSRRISIRDEKIAFWTSISLDLMFVIGLLLWILGDKGYKLLEVNGWDVVKQNSAMRFYVMEHPIMMFISVVLVHIGKVAISKKHSNKILSRHHNAYRNSFLYMAVALVLMLAAIPWPWREALGRPLF